MVARARYWSCASSYSLLIFHLHCRRLTAGGSHENIILQDIHNWLSCNFQEIDIDTLVDRFHLFYNDSMNDFFKCASDHVYKLRILRSNAAYNHDKAKTRNSNNTLITRNLEAINNCLSKAKQNCSEAHLRVIKFVRLRMSLIAKLLPLNHNMKVVYLQRDPRGSFSSRAIAGLIKGGPSTFRMDVINHCNASLEDIGTVKLLAKRYPGRIKAVLYEDVAESPIETLQSIFTFCDLNFSSDMRNYTLSLTSLGSNDSCAYCIKRGNSTETAYKWRKKMPFTNVNFIDKQCSEVYKILGYKKFSRLINLRNVSLTTRTSSRLIL